MSFETQTPTNHKRNGSPDLIRAPNVTSVNRKNASTVGSGAPPERVRAPAEQETKSADPATKKDGLIQRHIKLLIVAGSLLFSLASAEAFLRIVIFTPSLHQFFRLKTDMFAYYDSVDYWKLEYWLERHYPPPEHPHPLLGWVGQFDKITLLHNDAPQLGMRKPVLLYGDSFAACTASTCFQDLLNGDPGFAQTHFLLNYGVPGYGLDQIYLLLSSSVDLYSRPLVIISFLTADADRSLLPARTGQKPYFELDAGELKLRGLPLSANPHDFYSQNSPTIYSYFLSRVAKSKLMPKALGDFVLGERNRRKEVVRLNEAILHKMISELRALNLEFFFIVFHSIGSYDGTEWRNQWLLEILQREQVRYIWSEELLKNSALPAAKLFIPNNGHPTDMYNRMIAGEIKRMVAPAPIQR